MLGWDSGGAVSRRHLGRLRDQATKLDRKGRPLAGARGPAIRAIQAKRVRLPGHGRTFAKAGRARSSSRGPGLVRESDLRSQTGIGHIAVDMRPRSRMQHVPPASSSRSPSRKEAHRLRPGRSTAKGRTAPPRRLQAPSRRLGGGSRGRRAMGAGRLQWLPVLAAPCAAWRSPP